MIKKQTNEEYINRETAIDNITTELCNDITCAECPFNDVNDMCKVREWLKTIAEGIKRSESNALPSVKPQEPYDFAKWVASEIFDDMWEHNQGSFAEIACRKLARLGIVRAKGDEWELVEPQESEVNNG